MQPWMHRLAGPSFSRAATAVAMLGAAAFLPVSASAQTGQRFSIQGSALYANHFGSSFGTLTPGEGVELQLRYTPGPLSIGSGVQYTIHGDDEAKRDGHDANIKLVGVFVEPRYVVATSSDRAAPYLSGRLAAATFHVHVNFSDGDVLTFTSNGVTANVGGGLLVRLSDRVNLDAGATVGYSSYQDTQGSISGKPFDMQMGSGGNVVARVGLAVGLGR